MLEHAAHAAASSPVARSPRARREVRRAAAPRSAARSPSSDARSRAPPRGARAASSGGPPRGARRAAVDRIARDRQPRPTRGARGSGACGPSRGAPRAARGRAPRSARARATPVAARSRPTPVRRVMRLRSRGWRPIARVDAAGRRRRRAAHDRQVDALDAVVVELRGERARARRRASPTTSTPDVPRSSRCTMPGPQHAADRPRGRRSGGAARSRACRPDGRAPGARRGRPACRRRSGPRPRGARRSGIASGARRRRDRLGRLGVDPLAGRDALRRAAPCVRRRARGPRRSSAAPARA